MARELAYTDKALADLDDIARWLTQPGAGPAARRRMTAIWAAIDQLRRHPCLYSIGRHTGLRELPTVGGYRVVYEVVPDTGRDDTAGDVRVLRVFGPGQDRANL